MAECPAMDKPKLKTDQRGNLTDVKPVCGFYAQTFSNGALVLAIHYFENPEAVRKDERSILQGNLSRRQALDLSDLLKRQAEFLKEDT